jgi:hypothetical protein
MKRILTIVILAAFIVTVILVAGVNWVDRRRASSVLPQAPRDALELIRQLGDANNASRNAAFDELRRIGAPALPQLQAALHAVRPEVAADIRTLIRLIGGTLTDTPAAQPPAAVAQPQPPAPPAAVAQPQPLTPQDWESLPELPRPAPQAQGGDALTTSPAAMTPAERALFERKMQNDKNLRDLILLLRARTPEMQEDTLVWMEWFFGVNSWDFTSIRRYLGLTLKPMTSTAVFALDLLGSFGARLSVAADGMRVTELRNDSPAAAAGLQVGDLITHLNGRPLTDMEKAREWLAQSANGQPTRLEVKRRDDELTLTVPKR